MTHFDYHATLLHLFGLDHTRLTFNRGATEATFTDGQKTEVAGGILRRAVKS